ncbi:MAG: amidohydrolase family protein [Thermomicrobiales bacterium]
MEFDLIIRNGNVVDGSGAARIRGDVGVKDGRIAAVGDLSAASAAEAIDASGRIVAPGFIDVHIHSEVNLLDPSNPLRYGALLQGVTTHLAGPTDSAGRDSIPTRARNSIRPRYSPMARFRSTSIGRRQTTISPSFPARARLT